MESGLEQAFSCISIGSCGICEQSARPQSRDCRDTLERTN